MADTAPEYVKDQKDQLYAGFNSLGRRLISYRSVKYATMKNSMNPVPGYGNPDLKLTGAFYDAIRADIDEEGFLVYSTDDKSNSLEDKYGNEIWTLGEDALKGYINEELSPVFYENVTKQLNATV